MGLEHMSAIWKVIAGFLIVFIITASLLFIFNRNILRSGAPSFLKTIIVLLFQPDDLYESLFYQRLDIKKSPYSLKFSFAHRYPGRHIIGFLFYNENEQIDNIKDLDIKGTFECKSKENIIIPRSIHPLYYYFVKEGYGVVLFEYNVPGEMPIKGTITCNIYFEFLPDWMYYNAPTLVVKKISDL